jgi:hypothetical protein
MFLSIFFRIYIFKFCMRYRFVYQISCRLCARYWIEGKGRESRPYDLWSVGITWLELIFGTPHVFSISERMRVILHQALHLDQQPPVRTLILASRPVDMTSLTLTLEAHFISTLDERNSLKAGKTFSREVQYSQAGCATFSGIIMEAGLVSGSFTRGFSPPLYRISTV